ncbi:MAG: ABC transporter ATP-binding protein [Desulfovibrionaceae bacterium]|nr:ABC transporter ATP-binding protein [Desulfovibrionaceae bacterium]
MSQSMNGAAPQTGPAAGALLDVRDLSVSFKSGRTIVQAVRGISFSVMPHEFFSLVGETGSGKSVTVMTAMGLLDANGSVNTGSIDYAGVRLLDSATPRRRWRRTGDMAMIFQYPMMALNPIRTIGLQLRDVLKTLEDRPSSGAEAEKRALELLDMVRIRDPRRCLGAYPFELSGGMCQRVLIAMALARRPRLLFADEPTTGLDTLTQGTILKLLREMMDATGMSVLFITHDLGLAMQYSDRAGVMRHGELLEAGTPETLVEHPRTAYTKRLFSSTPSLMESLDDVRRLGSEIIS